MLYLNHFLFVLFTLLCCICNSKEVLANDKEGVARDSLQDFVENFQKISFPFQFLEAIKEKEIPANVISQFLDVDLNEEGVGDETYYYGYVFYHENFMGLVIGHHYSPGAFGINNDFIEVFTMTNEGGIIDGEVIIGCFCNDSNMQSNEYTSSEVQITIYDGQIVIEEREVLAQLIEDEAGPSKEIVTNKIYKYEIDLLGNIKRI